MLFNPCNSIDFQPEFVLDGNTLEVVEQTKLLGLTIQSDLKWHENTKGMIEKANKRLWILRRLVKMGASVEDLLDVYVLQIRCVLEYAAPVWQGSISQCEKEDIERVQKTACRIILSSWTISYEQALFTLNLDSLEDRRSKLTLKFALKAEKHPKFRNWFVKRNYPINTRNQTQKYQRINAKHSRYANSPLACLTDTLNAHYAKPRPI